MENNGKIWTVDHLKQLVDLAYSGKNISDIAELLGRSPKAAATKLHQILFRCGAKKAIIYLYLLRIDKNIYDFNSVIFFQKRAINRRKFNL